MVLRELGLEPLVKVIERCLIFGEYDKALVVSPVFRIPAVLL